MKAVISINGIRSQTDEAVAFIHNAIDNAVRTNVRVHVTLSPEYGDDNPEPWRKEAIGHPKPIKPMRV